MILTSSYGVHFKGSESAIKNTSTYYASAVKYLIPVVCENWNDIELISYGKARVHFVECLIHSNKNNQAVYDPYLSVAELIKMAYLCGFNVI